MVLFHPWRAINDVGNQIGGDIGRRDHGQRHRRRLRRRPDARCCCWSGNGAAAQALERVLATAQTPEEKQALAARVTVGTVTDDLAKIG